VTWAKNGPVWCRFFNGDADRYHAAIDGYIRRVYADGSATYYDRQQRLVTIPPKPWQHWATREECEAEIAKQPWLDVPTISERVSR
jgi:hypothetical protein